MNRRVSYNNDYMNNLQKIRTAFNRQGFNPTSQIHRSDFERILNNLITGDFYTAQVTAQIWEQASDGRTVVTVEELSRTIFDAQNIIQIKLFDLSDDIKKIQEELRYHSSSGSTHRRASQLMQQIEDKQQQKKSFEDDLAILTQPFGISMIAFMANAGRSRMSAGKNSPSRAYNAQPEGDPRQEVELKWLFYLCMVFGLIELVVIYQKDDFLNLMVFACLMLIFFMNQLDSTYIKFTLGLLVFSEVMDIVWLFLWSATYWNLPAVGTISRALGGYMKLIVILTYIGVFVKIPLGVFLFHYRNLDESKQFVVNLTCLKISLTPDKINPISDGLKNMELVK